MIRRIFSTLCLLTCLPVAAQVVLTGSAEPGDGSLSLQPAAWEQFLPRSVSNGEDFFLVYETSGGLAGTRIDDAGAVLDPIGIALGSSFPYDVASFGEDFLVLSSFGSFDGVSGPGWYLVEVDPRTGDKRETQVLERLPLREVSIARNTLLFVEREEASGAHRATVTDHEGMVIAEVGLAFPSAGLPPDLDVVGADSGHYLFVTSRTATGDFVLTANYISDSGEVVVHEIARDPNLISVEQTSSSDTDSLVTYRRGSDLYLDRLTPGGSAYSKSGFYFGRLTGEPGQSLLVFEVGGRGNPGPFVVRGLDSNGEIGPMMWLPANSDELAELSSVASTETHILVTWQVTNPYPSFLDQIVQVFDGSLQPVAPPSHVAFSAPVQEPLDLASSGDGSLAAWKEYRVGEEQVRLQVFESDLSFQSGVSVFPGSDAKVAASGTSYLVAVLDSETTTLVEIDLDGDVIRTVDSSVTHLEDLGWDGEKWIALSIEPASGASVLHEIGPELAVTRSLDLPDSRIHSMTAVPGAVFFEIRLAGYSDGYASSEGLAIRHVSTSGEPVIGPLQILVAAPETATDPNIRNSTTGARDSSFLIAWTEQSSVRTRLFSSSGTEIGRDFRPSKVLLLGPTAWTGHRFVSIDPTGLTWFFGPRGEISGPVRIALDPFTSDLHLASPLEDQLTILVQESVTSPDVGFSVPRVQLYFAEYRSTMRRRGARR